MRTRAIHVGIKDIRRIALFLAYPALRQIPSANWEEALQRARDADFDSIEWLGVLGGLVAVTYLLRIDPEEAASLSLPMRYIFQFLAALPLLLVIVGPFYVRRTRRGLEQEIARRRDADPSISQG